MDNTCTAHQALNIGRVLSGCRTPAAWSDGEEQWCSVEEVAQQGWSEFDAWYMRERCVGWEPDYCECGHLLEDGFADEHDCYWQRAEAAHARMMG